MQRFVEAVEKHKQLILNVERDIWATPETGFKEIKTSAYLQEIFENLGYQLTLAGDIPGFYTVFDTEERGLRFLF